MTHYLTRVAVATAAAAAIGALAPAPALAQGAGSSSSAFNPAIGLILTGTYAQMSQDPAQYAIPGFALGEDSGPGDRGFAIGEAELAVDANVDPNWYGFFTLSLENGSASVENAYVQTSSLGHGLTVRAGRFFSGIGYLNEQHSHKWDFVDTALPYRALLGTQYGDDGVQVRWLAPTTLFAEFGGEWLRGDAFPAGGAASDGRGVWSAFVHIGGDIGVSSSWRAGVSYLHAKSDGRQTDGAMGTDSFTGTGKLVVADFVWKWAPKGNPYTHNAQLQAEYLLRKEDGQFTPAGAVATAYSARPSGWYVQATYQFVPRWRIGLRYDQLEPDDAGAAFAGTVLDPQGHTPRRGSAMVDFANSEFSRLRLQYNRDQSVPQADNQCYLQYIMSLGAHGAHIF